MRRLNDAWRAMEPERRVAAIAAVALLLTMFFPWYGLQSLNRKTGVIYSHNISAFGDVSFVEAAIFLVAAGIVAMLLARAEGRRFHMPGGDGTIVLAAGAWAGLLIFYRVFSRPAGDGYPVGIEWGFFLAFVAAGGLAFAGLRMRGSERPAAPLVRARREPRHPPAAPDPGEHTTVIRASAIKGADSSATEPPGADERRRPAAPVAAKPNRERTRAPYPPAPAPVPSKEPEQLSFDDPPTRPL
jgi:hypothetical protein